ncbi:MAG: hypothetical protein JF615_06565 [Asticcacaulis sp.]|nr:hypothetical protein [Asticcacaulis sp.]
MPRILCLFALCLPLVACSTAPASEARRRPLTEAETCDMVADIARQVGDGPFDPLIKPGIDCEESWTSKGLPLFAGAARMNAPNVANSAQDRGYVFFAPEFTGDTTATVKMDFVCRNLCGHGELLSVELQGGRWVITDRKTTWIS